MGVQIAYVSGAQPNLTMRHILQAKNMTCHTVRCINTGPFLHLHVT